MCGDILDREKEKLMSENVQNRTVQNGKNASFVYMKRDKFNGNYFNSALQICKHSACISYL